MARKNRRAKEYDPYFEEELYQEFINNEEMRKAKLEGKKTDLKIRRVEPITENQKLVYEHYKYGNNLVLYGCAGTGKTYLSFYLALCEVLAKKYKKLIIIRSAVESRSVGFLPGTLEEKIAVYKEPYMAICAELFECADAYQRLEKLGLIEFVSSSYLRGMTFRDCIVIADEFENYAFRECDTIITRMGPNSKIIFCGDYEQSDLVKQSEKEECRKFIRILDNMSSFKFVCFEEEDIVRSGLVKSYIIAKKNLFG